MTIVLGFALLVAIATILFWYRRYYLLRRATRYRVTWSGEVVFDPWLYCSGDPASCEHNEGFGCCQEFAAIDDADVCTKPEGGIGDAEAEDERST